MTNRPVYRACRRRRRKLQTCPRSLHRRHRGRRLQVLSVLTELKNQGVGDVSIVCCDGLKGLPEAIKATWLVEDVGCSHGLGVASRFHETGRWTPTWVSPPGRALRRAGGCHRRHWCEMDAEIRAKHSGTDGIKTHRRRPSWTWWV